MSTYTGSLQPKKKQELQEIALALNISDSGTRDELQNRIKNHLSLHEVTLAEDPRFAGLYGRNRKRSAQPQMQPVKEDAVSVSSEDHDERIRTTQTHRVSRLARGTPPRNDSVTKVLEALEPADLPLPPSPIPSAVVQAASAIGRDATALVQKVRQQERTMAIEGRRLLKNAQGFLSDATNIYSITLLLELFVMLYTVLPFSLIRIPLNPPYKVEDAILAPSTLVVSIPYPAPSFIFSSAFWTLLGKWSLPTLVIPQLCGALISFSVPSREVDPVTIGIVRVACSVASQWGIEEDILSTRWRILSASIGAAFAFAESIGERRKASLFTQAATTSRRET